MRKHLLLAGLLCLECGLRLAVLGLQWCRWCLEHWQVAARLDQLYALMLAQERGLEPDWRWAEG